MPPNDVNSENVGDLLDYMLKKQQVKKEKQIFKIGDLVRITTLKKAFTKASKETFTDELFKIRYVSTGYPKLYKIHDSNGEPIVGSFYGTELHFAEPEALSHKRVEKAINIGKNRYKVHFKNWPKTFDTILDKKELKFYERPK